MGKRVPVVILALGFVLGAVYLVRDHFARMPTDRQVATDIAHGLGVQGESQDPYKDHAEPDAGAPIALPLDTFAPSTEVEKLQRRPCSTDEACLRAVLASRVTDDAYFGFNAAVMDAAERAARRERLGS
jgi:hypothetical protein